MPKVSEGMFFLMRKIGDVCIYPQWEDPNNTNGGYWSFKVSKQEAEKAWFELMMFMLGECITNKHIEQIIDVSTRFTFIYSQLNYLIRHCYLNALYQLVHKILHPLNTYIMLVCINYKSAYRTDF